MKFSKAPRADRKRRYKPRASTSTDAILPRGNKLTRVQHCIPVHCTRAHSLMHFNLFGVCSSFTNHRTRSVPFVFPLEEISSTVLIQPHYSTLEIHGVDLKSGYRTGTQDKRWESYRPRHGGEQYRAATTDRILASRASRFILELVERGSLFRWCALINARRRRFPIARAAAKLRGTLDVLH